GGGGGGGRWGGGADAAPAGDERRSQEGEDEGSLHGVCASVGLTAPPNRRRRKAPRARTVHARRRSREREITRVGKSVSAWLTMEAPTIPMPSGPRTPAAPPRPSASGKAPSL